ncbi:MAG: ABC-F family ATP-binding cassette domain-containing protein [Dehalococcoidales bacterium]|nr:ABC-F family ATP-binding cassette domain-containing protein [Dehalococcoidales bacterium]
MLSVVNISKAYGEQVLFSGMTFNVGARDRIAVIGPNGSGKTTLFEIITGNIASDSGSIARRKDITIGYARQEITPESHERLLDHVSHASTRIAGLEHRLRVLQEALTESGDDGDTARLMRELGELQHRFEIAGGYDVEHEAEVILSGLGFKEEDFQRPLCEFSGGWLMRVTLAKLLVVNPDMLLLDEPTNHLDLESCIWFEDYLKSYQGAVMVTSHDRAFLNRVAGRIIAIEKDDVILYNGSYDDYVLARQQDQETREATARRQGIRIKKEMRFIERFRYKATKAAAVQSRMKALAKIEKVVVPRTSRKIHFNFPEPRRSGEEVIALRHIRKSYDGLPVYRDLNLTLRRNDRVALVGPNGAGKTTLLKIMAGVLPFDEGERKLGHNVDTSYYAQYQLELLEGQNTVLEELQRAAPDEAEQVLRGMLGAFLFSGDDVFKKVEVLSGGEKSRLSLARMLVRPANFLLMDEPTNHLDISSREMLVDALEAYHGSLCFITHDRTVIREIANKIVEIRNGEPVVYEGSYDEYLDWKEKTGMPDDDNALAGGMNGRGANVSSREIQRQRKAAEGELRNRFYRETSPLKKHISNIEGELARLEPEFSRLESYLATPEAYGNTDDLRTVTIRHHELMKTIPRLTAEWEKLSLEAEQKKREFEEARKRLEEEYRR